MSPDPCISIHMYLRILCKIHVSGFMSQHPFVSQEPLQDPCLRIHVSASSYLRILCTIHVSNSCLGIPVSASMCISGPSARSMSPDPYLRSHMHLRILYKIHVFGFMSQHLCVSRILCKIHVSGSVFKHPYVSQDPLQDPCLWIHVSASLHLRILYEIHAAGSIAQQPYVSQDPLQDPCVQVMS